MWRHPPSFMLLMSSLTSNKHFKLPKFLLCKTWDPFHRKQISSRFSNLFAVLKLFFCLVLCQSLKESQVLRWQFYQKKRNEQIHRSQDWQLNFSTEFLALKTWTAISLVFFFRYLIASLKDFREKWDFPLDLSFSYLKMDRRNTGKGNVQDIPFRIVYFMSRKQFGREMPSLASSGVSQIHVDMFKEIQLESGSTVHKL